MFHKQQSLTGQGEALAEPLASVFQIWTVFKLFQVATTGPGPGGGSGFLMSPCGD